MKLFGSSTGSSAAPSMSSKKQPPIKSLIAEGSCIEGQLRFTDGMRVDGQVIGDIRASKESPSLLVVSETAMIDGEVHVDHVIINGLVKGPVHVNMLELQPKARVEGNVYYKAMELHQGAVITGQLTPQAPEQVSTLMIED